MSVIAKMCMYASVNVENCAAKRTEKRREVNVKKKKMKSDLYFARCKSQYVYAYFPRFANILKFSSRTFCSTRTRVFENTWTLTTHPSQKKSETCPSSVEKWSKLYTMNNDRLTDFFSSETFAAAAAAIAL